MRKFSRWMPPASRPPMTLGGWFFLAGLLAGAVAATVAWPVVVGFFLGVPVVFMIVGNYVGNRHLRRLAAERTGQDLGTFARAFDRRTQPFDPWVLRATWDAFEPYVVFRGGRLPLRPTDRLEEDLRIDPDDLAFDLFQEVAARSGRSLDQPESNPLYGHVNTVGDFVRFITFQPRVAGKSKAAEPGNCT